MKKNALILVLILTVLFTVSCISTNNIESEITDNTYIDSGLVGTWLPAEGQNLFGYGFEFTDDGHFNYVYAADPMTDYSAFGIDEEELKQYIDEINATEPTYRITAANAIELNIVIDGEVQSLPTEFELDGDALKLEGTEYKRQ